MDRDSIRRILEAKKLDIEAKIAAANAAGSLSSTKQEADLDGVPLDDTSPSISVKRTILIPQFQPGPNQTLPPAVKLENGQSGSTSSIKTESPESVPTKKRKSRWGPEADVAPVPSFVPDQSSIQLAQLKVQLAAKEILLKTKAGVVESELGVPSQEHRMRLMEMEKTKELAAKLTVSLHQGGHHMQDFLPPEVMAKFQKTTDSSSAGSSSSAQYEENKLDKSNVGYQMLKKFGWTEGKGLGMAGTGISAPISSVAPVERAGLGTKRPDEPSADDDEFELYRKRMMTAYKYRPNPLNNPRRPYY